jgi:hypothetical protein
MKHGVAPVVTNSNIWGGRQISGCTTSTTRLKLHRKRVVKKHQKREQGSGGLFKRGIPYGPDSTYFQGQAQTTTSTSTITQTLATT